jgi:hypothetical protein
LQIRTNRLLDWLDAGPCREFVAVLKRYGVAHAGQSRPEAINLVSERQAASGKRQARIILGQAETEISDSFVQAAALHAENPTAQHLRAMNILYEAIKERGSMVIVPSSAVETMGLGGSLATASLAGSKT